MSDMIDNKDINYQVMMGSYTVEEFVKQIDKLVYALYGLSAEEVSVVEGNRWSMKQCILLKNV